MSKESLSKALATNDVLEEESNDNDSDEEDDELNLITRKIKKYVEKQELLQVQRIIQKIFPQEKQKTQQTNTAEQEPKDLRGSTMCLHPP